MPKMYFLLRKCFCFPSRGLRNSQRCLVEATERPDLLVPVPFLHNAADITSAVTLIGFSSAKIPHMLNPGVHCWRPHTALALMLWRFWAVFLTHSHQSHPCLWHHIPFGVKHRQQPTVIDSVYSNFLAWGLEAKGEHTSHPFTRTRPRVTPPWPPERQAKTLVTEQRVWCSGYCFVHYWPWKHHEFCCFILHFCTYSICAY